MLNEFEERSYTDGIHYQLRLTARYMHVFITQLLKEFHSDLSIDEGIALDLVYKHKNLCVRDLAKMLLKDRANTGKLITSLEKKELVKINIEKRSNRIIKMLELTEKGKNFLEENFKKAKPRLKEISEMFPQDEEAKLIKSLINFREKLSSVMEINI